MSEDGVTSLCDEIIEWDLDGNHPKGERWAPLGASDADEQTSFHSPYEFREQIPSPDECDRLHELQEEQEQLNNSLLALTTHFAQVQFRLRQLVEAPSEEKEVLLRELEEFAFRGIPDVRAVEKSISGNNEEANVQSGEELLCSQRERQLELINQLKTQLDDLEAHAYATGKGGLPQGVLLERQKALLEQLKGRLNLSLDCDLETMSPEELRLHVDSAVGQLVNPLKVKEHLVTQLKTQIGDLERFINFLQGTDGSSDMDNHHTSPHCTCDCPVHNHPSRSGNKNGGSKTCQDHSSEPETAEELHSRTLALLKMVVQMFAVSQFGCATEHVVRNSVPKSSNSKRNTLKQTSKGNHWGDLRARLEVAISHVEDLCIELGEGEGPFDSDYTSDSEESPSLLCNEQLTTAVRKELAMALKDLLQHGLCLYNTSSGTSLVPLVGCFTPRTSPSYHSSQHAWDLLLHFYDLKGGAHFNSTPQRRLSQSFNLDLTENSCGHSNKQRLLATIGSILTSHGRYKRSNDAHFKAFVCAALNHGRLSLWLRQVVTCRSIVNQSYQPWSYVAQTGADDTMKSLDRLSALHFHLPVDLAVSHLSAIRDAFL